MYSFPFNPRVFLKLLLLLTFFACQTDSKDFSRRKHHATSQISPQYAQCFNIEIYPDYKKLNVFFPNHKNKESKSYYLIDQEDSIPRQIAQYDIIKTPVKSMVCLSSNYLTMLDELDILNTLSGVSKRQHINNVKILERIKKASISEVGDNYSINREKVYKANPDILLTYAQGEDKSLAQLLPDVQIVETIEHLETTPLGRAEWIKFLGVFLNQEEKADSIFNQIAHSYNSAKQLTQSLDNKPTVLTNIMYGDAWYLPGGNSFIANLIKDAGGSYILKDDPQTGNLPLAYEVVFSKANNADYWINIGSFETIGELVESDTRYKSFTATQIGNLYNNNLRMNQFGGNDYFESGTLYCDIVLKDLIRVFHPELLPDHELYYYQKLD